MLLPGPTRSGALAALLSLRENRTSSAACASSTSL